MSIQFTVAFRTLLFILDPLNSSQWFKVGGVYPKTSDVIYSCASITLQQQLTVSVVTVVVGWSRHCQSNLMKPRQHSPAEVD